MVSNGTLLVIGMILVFLVIVVKAQLSEDDSTTNQNAGDVADQTTMTNDADTGDIDVGFDE